MYVLRLRLLAGQPYQRDFGQPPGMQRLPGLFGIGRGDAGPMIGPKDDDLLMGQLFQHATNVTASTLNICARLSSVKRLAACDALFENGIEDPRVEIIREGFPC